jgi:hypothetical protein
MRTLSQKLAELREKRHASFEVTTHGSFKDPAPGYLAFGTLNEMPNFPQARTSLLFASNFKPLLHVLRALEQLGGHGSSE